MNQARRDPPHPDIIATARRVQRARVVLARRDPALFNEYVLRDEETGKPITNAPVHVSMHATLTHAPRAVLFSHIEAGKTQSITVGRTLFELGHNPSLRVAIVSNTAGQARKIVAQIGRYIQSSNELHEIFPALQPAAPWGAEQLTVFRSTNPKEPTLTATGVHGNILGSRFDLVILDDILDYEITRTEANRAELLRWYRATLGGRITPNGRVWAVGTPWDPDDLYHVFAKTPGFVTRRFPVQDPSTGALTWPGRWPLKRIEQRRHELGQVESQRQLDCVAPDGATSRFQVSWIQRCLDRGREYSLIPTLRDNKGKIDLPEGCFAVTGVDLGFTKEKKGAKTVFFTVLFYPNGDRQLIWIEAGDFSGPQIVIKAIEHSHRFGSVVYVENNGAQRLVLDFALDPDMVPVFRAALGANIDPGLIPIRPFQTGANKWHPTYGLESLGVEMEHGRWIIPNDGYDLAKQVGTIDPEVLAWCIEMKNYSRPEHTGDRMMASWFAREGGRGYFAQGGKVNARVIDEKPPEGMKVPEEIAEPKDDAMKDLEAFEAELFGT